MTLGALGEFFYAGSECHYKWSLSFGKGERGRREAGLSDFDDELRCMRYFSLVSRGVSQRV